MKSVTKRIYLIDFSLAVLGYILFVLFDTLNKKLTGSYHVSQIIFVNSISALLPIILFTQLRNGWIKLKTVALEANPGDIVLLSKHTVHCSLPNISNNFRISMDLRYHKSGQPSGRDLLPNFCVRSKNKKNIKIYDFKQWLSIWEKAKQRCLPKKYTFKYQTPTFKGKKRDLVNLI